jgi:hypothetical protein
MTDFKELKQEPVYPNTKFTIDIKKIFGQNKITEVHFEFKDFTNFTIEIRIEDKEYTSVRPLLENEMKQKGDRIIAPETGHTVDFYLDFEQNVLDEKIKKCQNYPTISYKNYKDCDKKFIRKTLDEFKLTNYTPIWATDKMEEVTEYM